MKTSNIAAIRFYNQQLANHNLKTPKQLIAWMGAMQAQDYGMAKWGIGARLVGITNKQVEEAINKGDIIRTHVMRPTWHFVSVDDIHWMLQLTAPRIKALLKASDKLLELTPDFISKTNAIIEKALSANNHLTRTELGHIISEKGIELDTRRLTHIMYHAEQDRLVCNGTVINNKQTYCLLEEKAPKPNKFDKDEALGKLAQKYFGSHAPATLQDFVWWSGLTVTEVKRAVQIINTNVVAEIIDGETYMFNKSANIDFKLPNTAQLLPAFDEFLVSYKNRSHVLADEHYSKIINSKNGMFKPFVLYNAQVIGGWKKVTSKKGVDVEVDYFVTPTKTMQTAVEKAVNEYKAFVN